MLKKAWMKQNFKNLLVKKHKKIPVLTKVGQYYHLSSKLSHFNLIAIQEWTVEWNQLRIQERE